MADFDDIVAAFVEAIPKAEIAALKRMEGLMKVRIHNQGLNTALGRIGQYSPGYAKKRRMAGRQVAYVDLEFDGDLRRGYTTGVTSDKGTNCIGFVNDAETAKASENDSRFSLTFYPTDQEQDEADEAYSDMLDKILRNALG